MYKLPYIISKLNHLISPFSILSTFCSQPLYFLLRHTFSHAILHTYISRENILTHTKIGSILIDFRVLFDTVGLPSRLNNFILLYIIKKYIWESRWLTVAVCFTSSSKPTRLTVNSIVILPITILALQRSLGLRILGVDLRHVIKSTHEIGVVSSVRNAGEQANYTPTISYKYRFFFFVVKSEKKKPSSQISSLHSQGFLTFTWPPAKTADLMARGYVARICCLQIDWKLPLSGVSTATRSIFYDESMKWLFVEGKSIMSQTIQHFPQNKAVWTGELWYRMDPLNS